MVTQCGGTCPSSGSLVRTFTYDGLSRLLTAQNPESGLVTYTYDGDGNVVTKVSPKVNASSGTQTIGYCYDSLNRKTYEFDASPNCPSPSGYVKTYTYDSSSISGAQNDIGRLTDEQSYVGSTMIAERSPYEYDAMGRLLADEQCPYGVSCAWHTFNYTYDLDGNVTSENDSLDVEPHILVYGFSYDRAGHLLEAQTTNQPPTWSTSTYPPVVYQANATGSSPAYDPMGHPVNVQLGLLALNGTPAIQVTRQYDNRGRITSEKENSGSLFSLSVAGGGYAGNGNLLKQTDAVMGTWSYTYDTLNRLTSGQSTSGAYNGDYGCWTYDAFGNRTLESFSNTSPCSTHHNLQYTIVESLRCILAAPGLDVAQRI